MDVDVVSCSFYRFPLSDLNAFFRSGVKMPAVCRVTSAFQ